MAKMYELRSVWQLGPFTKKKTIGRFESSYVAEHVMTVKLLAAKRKRHLKLHLELVDTRTNEVLKRGSSR